MIRKIGLVLGVALLASLPLVARGGHPAYKGDSEPTFVYGSLSALGTFTGLGGTDSIVTLQASGTPVVTCTNQGGNESPGQNPSIVTSSGTDFLTTLTKNGTAPFEVTAPTPTLDWLAGGCASANWTATVDFVFWTSATVSIHDASGELLFEATHCLETTPILDSAGEFVGGTVEVVSCGT